jgi:hypothetical protein
MSEQKIETTVTGLILIGKVNAKTSRVYKNGDEHFFLFIASPGSETMERVEVKPQDWGAYQEGSPFKSKVKSNVFNNQVTYVPVP